MRRPNTDSNLIQVNIIPVLAKADCLTKAEVKKKKEKIMKVNN